MKKTVIIFIFCAGVTFACSSPELTVELGELDVNTFTSSSNVTIWNNTVVIKGVSEVKVNQSISGNLISIAGTTYEKGVGVHADSEGYIRLSGEKGRFTAFVGIDDHVGSFANIETNPASVVFYVFTNKGIAFNSGVMRFGDAAKRVDIDLKGVTDLYLVTNAISDDKFRYYQFHGGKTNDHANWADAKFTVRTPPVAVKIETDEAPYILTPAPSPAPRINGAKITGASANKPFMFTVATSGERPMTFEAEDLPGGLTIDREKGIITGITKTRGKYIVPVTATNSRGTCRDTIQIVIGGDLALTPYMGWSSWNVFAANVTQKGLEETAQAIHDKRLIDFGYTYVNIDDGWTIRMRRRANDPAAATPSRYADGTVRPNENFPDMKGLTDYIHSLGLKAGLYSSPGRTTCAGFEGSFGHEAEDIKTYSGWGFDFLKYDWCTYQNEVPVAIAKEWALQKHYLLERHDRQQPYFQISNLMKDSDRDMILNICQYGYSQVWQWGKEVGGHAWRTTSDIGANTPGLVGSMFQIVSFHERLGDCIGPGGWNDPDYLLFGNTWNYQERGLAPTPFTPSEQYSCMTYWCMMPAPLIFSGEMTTLDDFTKNVLCNAEVIDVNQDKLGKAGRMIRNKDMVEVWKKELSDGSAAIAIFNKRPYQCKIEVDWQELGYNGGYLIRDLWRQSDLGTTREVTSFDIPRHGCVMLKVNK